MSIKTTIIRQNEELALIKTKFGNDVEDLRNENDGGWKPLNIRILLTPLRDSSGNGKTCVRAKLHIVCSDEYPKVEPKLSLEGIKGISNTLSKMLLKMLQQQALEMRGEIMILELVQTVQAFLINKNKPEVPHFVIPTVKSSHSRLKTEFEQLQHLGKGAFGDVLKVKNILDSRKYAIKRVPLVAKNHKFYKKMTREVELMSRLNHENVVRYFHSWIERAPDADMDDMKNAVSDDWSVSEDSTKPITPSTAETEKSFSNISKSFIHATDCLNFDDDGIEFLDSNGEVAVYDEESDEETSSVQPVAHVLYIQMEFCGNNTLRTVIDRDSLRPALLWRLFREILEGLCHIHKQFIIHRDLKPGNIFLDSSFRVKIGDFGQATTTFLTFRAHKKINYSNATFSETGTGTGEVGTMLYVAPELMGHASKSYYGQKVDMYPLGIILFEMIHPPFKTVMERISTIKLLRDPSVIIPEGMPNDFNHDRAVQIIRLLLNHDASKRPSAPELLRSKLVPPAQVEIQELDKVLRRTFADPQGKAHKHLVTKCLQQKSDDALQHIYNRELCVPQNPAIESVKLKVVNVFRKHGAIEMDIPMLTPISRNIKAPPKHVKLMTRSGGVVTLPSDLRVPFVWHVAVNDVNLIRRYSVDRVFTEKKDDCLHPEQKYKCSFDIITPKTDNQLLDAEILSVGYEIINEIPHLRDQDISIRLNHTSLLRSILIHCKVPPAKYAFLFRCIRAELAGRLSPFTEKSKITGYRLNKLLLADFIVGGPRNIADEPVLKCLLGEKGKVSSMAKRAIKELEATVMLAKNLGVTCPIHVCPGLAIGNNPASSNGVVWQMVADSISYGKSVQLAVGERYDKMLATFQKDAISFMSLVDIPTRKLSGAGLTFSLEKLVAASSSECNKAHRAIDVCVCVTKDMNELNNITNIMRDLWSAGIRSGIIEAATADEAYDRAKKLGAIHVIQVVENNLLCVRSWHREVFEVRHVIRNKLVECIQRLLRNDNKSTTPSINRNSVLSVIANNENLIKNEFFSGSKNLHSVY